MDELASKEKNLKDLSTTTINIINKIAIPLSRKEPSGNRIIVHVFQ
jgi:hypothetical protein